MKDTWRISPLAQEHFTLYESPDPQNLHAHSPGLDLLKQHPCLPKGVQRIFASFDLTGPAAADLSGAKFEKGERDLPWQGQIFSSDDRGATWQPRARIPSMHNRPFVVGESVYVLGQANDLLIIRSDDGGQTWTPPAQLTEGLFWHQAPCNVHYANGNVYLVMERVVSKRCRGWHIS